ncbi:RNA polymerase factor sigma-54 [Listeria ivanovii FSL F6-596]|nr:RNA polymerase factor sigma-54 [Listeria ivanovii FSL F6-596]
MKKPLFAQNAIQNQDMPLSLLTPKESPDIMVAKISPVTIIDINSISIAPLLQMNYYY